MRFDATCIRLAKRAHSNAIRQSTLPWRQASAVAQHTETNAPDRVFGRQASNHALKEFCFITGAKILFFPRSALLSSLFMRQSGTL